MASVELQYCSEKRHPHGWGSHVSLDFGSQIILLAWVGVIGVNQSLICFISATLLRKSPQVLLIGSVVGPARGGRMFKF